MRNRTRPATALLALIVAAVALAGCSDDADDEPEGRTTGSQSPVTGSAPGSPVLPDDLAVSPDGAQVLADCWQGICRWDTGAGTLAEVDDGSHVALSPDWSLLAGVGDDASVLLLDLPSRDVVQELAGLEDEEVTDGSPVTDVAFSPDGSLVAGAGLDGRVAVWSVDDGADVTTVETGGDVFALAFSPDGSRLATAGGGPTRVYDVATGEEVGTLAESADSSALAWSPDGRWLAASGVDGSPALWRASDLTLAERLPGNHLEQAAFAPGSRTLAFTDTEDDTVRLWSPASLGGEGRVLRELLGHTDAPEAVAWAPDGGTLYSVSGREGVFAWDARSGELRRELELPER
ncbi:PD40 domain-containing protein [Nocardioides sp. 503]|uniref:WD40 repeat domain-containing protein n=1 Tax=Nocardioides sp. 503 TaxID=2508326 RepID=UPI00106FCB52|nr:PD40 domain-containing protein [Nocardioides sp. 503]